MINMCHVRKKISGTTQRASANAKKYLNSVLVSPIKTNRANILNVRWCLSSNLNGCLTYSEGTNFKKKDLWWKGRNQLLTTFCRPTLSTTVTKIWWTPSSYIFGFHSTTKRSFVTCRHCFSKLASILTEQLEIPTGENASKRMWVDSVSESQFEGNFFKIFMRSKLFSFLVYSRLDSGCTPIT